MPSLDPNPHPATTVRGDGGARTSRGCGNPRAACARLAAAGRDPRHLQILALGALLWHGIGNLDFAIASGTIPVILTCTLVTQWCCTRVFTDANVDLRSPLISALSLCLLLRVDDLALAGAAGVLAVTSKFVLRLKGSHVYNPSALAIAVVVLCFDGAWVSPGQWGQAALAGLLVAGFGLLVLTRARRLDVMLMFLTAWALALFARAEWYGDPLTIPLHQLGNGAVMLFAFFMITDPRTTPSRRSARLLFTLAVALAAAWISFTLYRPDALILALVACAPLCPLLDALTARTGALPAPRPARRRSS